MAINTTSVRHISLKNQLQTFGLLALMGLFCWLLGSWLFGPDFAIVAVIIGVIGMLLNPALSSSMLMKAYGATPIQINQSPELVHITQLLRAKKQHLCQ